jgi:hypothetical protein
MTDASGKFVPAIPPILWGISEILAWTAVGVGTVSTVNQLNQGSTTTSAAPTSSGFTRRRDDGGNGPRFPPINDTCRPDRCDRNGEQGPGQDHHIATDKNFKKGAQWSSAFQDLFARAGLTLQNCANKVILPNHRGPHNQSDYMYHQLVYEELSQAVEGRSGAAYREALLDALERICIEIMTPGSVFNTLLTTRGPR